MSESQFLPVTIFLLIIYEIVKSLVNRAGTSAVKKHVSSELGVVKGQVLSVEKKVEAGIVPATQRAAEASSKADHAVEIMEAMKATFMPLLELYRAQALELATANKTLAADNRQKELLIESYQETIDKLMRDIETVKAQLKVQDTEHQRQLDDLHKRTEQMAHDLSQNKSDMERLRQEYEETKRQLASTLADLEAAKKQILDLEAERDQIRLERETERAKAIEAAKRLEKELQEAHAEVARLQNRVTELEGQVAALESQLKAAPPPVDNGGSNVVNPT